MGTFRYDTIRGFTFYREFKKRSIFRRHFWTHLIENQERNSTENWLWDSKSISPEIGITRELGVLVSKHYCNFSQLIILVDVDIDSESL